jgi:hypothetical protein
MVRIVLFALVGAVAGTVLAVSAARAVGGGLRAGTAFASAALLAGFAAASAAGVVGGRPAPDGTPSLRLYLTGGDGLRVAAAALLAAALAAGVGSRLGAFRRRGRAP